MSRHKNPLLYARPCPVCQKLVTEQQVRKWYYAKRPGVLEPYCSRSCFKVDYHLHHPEVARQAGLRGAAKRPSVRGESIGRCPHAAGPARDAWIYARGYNAGRTATSREARRAVKQRWLAA
jgi:hypothetical protein